MPGWRSGRGHRVIEHLQGRENSLEPFGWTGTKSRMERLGLSTRRRPHHPGTTLFHLRMNRWQALRFVQALVTKQVGRRRQPAGMDSVPDLQPADLPGVGHRGHPPPPGGFCGNPPPAPARARLRAGASRLALAADRDGEGPCLRLEQQARKHRYKTMIEGFASWGSTRIAIGGF